MSLHNRGSKQACEMPRQRLNQPVGGRCVSIWNGFAELFDCGPRSAVPTSTGNSMSLTTAQKEAIAARGNVLVVAGAGTGKTRTLVERCLNCLLEGSPRASLDQILMVTFTEAAAAEMRQRVRLRLEEQLKRTPDALHWNEQVALFDSAHIGTLHSFCLQLVRSHFYELELDPQMTVLAEEEARLLADETLTSA